jgi:alcohol oxidase
VVESGPNNYNEPDIVNPALAIKNISPGSKTSIVYKGVKSKALAGRELTVLSGGTLGGGSSINLFM